MEANQTQQRALNHVERPVTRPPALIFGIPVADITLNETLTTIGDLVRDGRNHGRTHQVCTVNVDFLVNALGDRHVADILRRATLCLPDGMPVVWASRMLGTPIRARVAGSDLVPLLIEQSATCGWHVHIFGSSPDVANRAREELRSCYPSSRFTIEPGPIITDVSTVADDVLDGIAAVDADILCVALGNPKQELFIDAHRERLGVPVMIGVGGSVDMIVGEQRRAPAWMQRTGLEWVWRAGTDPRRLGPRYARDLRVFAPALVHDWRQSWRHRGGSGLEIAFDDGRIEMDITGSQSLSAARYQDTVDRLMDGSGLHIVDHGIAPMTTALAQLIGLVAVARRDSGVEWAQTAPPSWIEERRLPANLLAWHGAPEPTNSRHVEDRGGYHGPDGE
jgi:exopolysaccharide biosynthesis WecB/TagA/CpsF family protein